MKLKQSQLFLKQNRNALIQSHSWRLQPPLALSSAVEILDVSTDTPPVSPLCVRAIGAFARRMIGPVSMRLCLFLYFFTIPLFAALLNGTAAVVGKTLLTVQDVYLYRSILRFKEGESPAVLKEQEDQLKKIVQKLIFEEMVYSELKSFQYDGMPKVDAEKLINQVKNKHPNDWKAIQSSFQISEKELTERLFRTLQVEKFLKKKVDTLTPVITDSEIQAYYRQNEGKFKGNNFEELKPHLMVLLKKQKMQKGLEDWIKFLKEKYAVVNHLETY